MPAENKSTGKNNTVDASDGESWALSAEIIAGEVGH
jgi:hypothetical protein